MDTTSLAHTKTRKNVLTLRHNYDRRNIEAARIIAAQPERWGGPTAGLVMWAWLVLRRPQPKRNLVEVA